MHCFVAGKRLTRTFITFILSDVFFDFLLTVKAAPHESVIRTGQP